MLIQQEICRIVRDTQSYGGKELLEFTMVRLTPPTLFLIETSVG